jgi:hypothetical protein
MPGFERLLRIEGEIVQATAEGIGVQFKKELKSRKICTGTLPKRLQSRRGWGQKGCGKGPLE